MGLDTTHDCWHGSYSSFMEFREQVASAAGLPVLEKLWLDVEKHRNELAMILLDHSDCDGEIAVKDLEPLSVRLEALLPGMGEWRDHALRFIAGLRKAAAAGEPVLFQ